MDFSMSPATSGSGPRRHGPPHMSGRTSRRRPPAVLPLDAPRAPGSSPKEGHTCARPATATVTGRPLGKAIPSAAPLGTWVSAAQLICECMALRGLLVTVPSDVDRLPVDGWVTGGRKLRVLLRP